MQKLKPCKHVSASNCAKCIQTRSLQICRSRFCWREKNLLLNLFIKNIFCYSLSDISFSKAKTHKIEKITAEINWQNKELEIHSQNYISFIPNSFALTMEAEQNQIWNLKKKIWIIEEKTFLCLIEKKIHSERKIWKKWRD